MDAVMTVDPLSVEVGYALVSLVDEKQGGTLLSRVRAIGARSLRKTGIVVRRFMSLTIFSWPRAATRFS